MAINSWSRKRSETAKGAPRIGEIIRGSIVMMDRHCGNARCRCQRGFKHRSLYVSQRYKGRTRMIYIPKRSEATVRLYISNYLKFKGVMDKISDVNIRMLSKGQR
jgi:hypothetical protein